MYHPAYSQLFWGLLIVLINVRILGFDILPDFIGFLMVVSALNQLSTHHLYFEKARTYAFIQIFLSLQNVIVLSGNNILGKPESVLEIGFLLLGQLYMLLNLLMIYWICQAISTLAKDQNLHELHEKANVRWKMYSGLTMVILFGMPFTLNLDEKVVIYSVPIVLFQFLAMVFILALIRRAGQELHVNQH